MLNTICAEDCTRHTGKFCQVSCQDSPKFDLVIDSVEEKTNLKRPQDLRAPSSVLLKGPLQPSFSFGHLDLEISDEPFLSGVYISRIAPPLGLNPDSAYFKSFSIDRYNSRLPSTMQKLTLSAETAADEAFLRQLYASTRSDEMALVPWADEQKTSFLNQQFDLQRHHYRSYYPDAEFSVILIDGIRAGRWYVHRGAGCLLLIDISLMPDYRRQGIGQQLLETLQAEASETGKPIHLHVENFNPAQRLYTRLGFVLLEEQGVHRLMEWRDSEL